MSRMTLLLLALCTPLPAADVPARRTVAVSAQSEIWVKPDVAVLNVSIFNADMQLAVAKQNNDDSARAAAKVIESHHLKPTDYKLTELQIAPEFSGRVIMGYSVERSFEFRLYDFKNVDGFLADLVEACGDALRVDSLRYRVTDQRRHQIEARRLAVLYAHEKATHLAELNGLALGDAVSIHEGIEYNSNTDGFGGFGAMGVSVPHETNMIVAGNERTTSRASHRPQFVGIDAEASPTPEPVQSLPDGEADNEIGNAGSVEQTLLTAVGQVNLTAAVTIEWELVPQTD